MAHGITRRELLGGAALVAGGVVLGGCGAASPRAVGPNAVEEPETKTTFPLLEVRGGPYEIGQAIGKRFAREIREGFAERAAWFKDLKAFADAQGPAVEKVFVDAIQKHAPQVLLELRGWADGSGVPFRDLLLLNLNPELGALRDQTKKGAGGTMCEPSPGCSTIAVAEEGRLVVAHNEDGDMAYAPRMFLVRLRPEGKPAVLAACYPGVLAGNAPWVNEHGVVMTTNFISTREVKLGVPRYVLDRLAMEAPSLDEALTICRHRERAYSFHHLIGQGDRLLTVEATPSRFSSHLVRGLYLHTNHLVHRELADVPQEPEYVGTSSMTRWKTLQQWRLGLPSERGLEPAALVAALASHEGRPYSPCRHPEGSVRGATELTAVIDVRQAALRLYRGNPCRGLVHDYRAPAR